MKVFIEAGLEDLGCVEAPTPGCGSGSWNGLGVKGPQSDAWNSLFYLLFILLFLLLYYYFIYLFIYLLIKRPSKDLPWAVQKPGRGYTQNG